MNAHTMTPKQYFQARRRALLAEYPNANPEAVKETLQEESLMDDWVRGVFDAARDGALLKPIVIDRLFQYSEHSFWLLFKWHHETAVPAGYLNPKVRWKQ